MATAQTTVQADPPGARRNEWILVIFTGTTNIADAVARIALPLLAAQISRSPVVVTAVAAIMSLPWLVAALHVGVFVDRMDRRALMMAAEIARMVSVGALLVAVLAASPTLALIYVAALVIGLADVVAGIAGASIVPSAVPKHRWETANARITALEYLFNGFAGQPIGGFLVAIGFGLALGVTGFAYVVGAVLLLLLVGNFKVAATTRKRSVNEDIREGIRFLWQHRLLRTMALLIAIMAGCWAAWLALIPVYAVNGPLGLDERQYGFLLTCLGAGGVIGTVIVGPVNRWIGRRWSMFTDIIGAFALVAAPALLPAAPSSAWAIGVAAFVAGAGGTMWTVNSRFITQSLVPADMLGRFSAASRLVAWGMTPVAAILAGILAQVFSYQVAFGFFAVLCVLLIYPFFKVVTAERIAEVDGPAGGAADPVPGGGPDGDRGTGTADDGGDLPEAATTGGTR
ncbi:MFS transporter [Micromonospora peucetia]|uniref:MFS transporter n=1 Tax=Micromonospora peucetia TaxID=47871 RepID=A0A1C6UKF5_9ACTN|nr:MFS transporter [Micromonospora peucetia]WSA34225.1 MFS transporter [Micromonospora peucetia]SCL54461.1 Predicted arabinose efflux permease, MFS family [Micromonospora peucetia]